MIIKEFSLAYDILVELSLEGPWDVPWVINCLIESELDTEEFVAYIKSLAEHEKSISIGDFDIKYAATMMIIEKSILNNMPYIEAIGERGKIFAVDNERSRAWLRERYGVEGGTWREIVRNAYNKYQGRSIEKVALKCLLDAVLVAE
ncbi:MAG: hypothetical protein RML94_00195 [Bacteroidia bacterium]|nr:hypothetical protein [Bacteroidia bacterium]